MEDLRKARWYLDKLIEEEKEYWTWGEHWANSDSDKLDIARGRKLKRKDKKDASI